MQHDQLTHSSAGGPAVEAAYVADPDAEINPGPSPEAIKMLEEARLPPNCKAAMLLVALGFRPATMAPIARIYPLDGELSSGMTEEVDQYIAAATALGLSVDTVTSVQDLAEAALAKGRAPDTIPALIAATGQGANPQFAEVDVFMGRDELATTTLKDAWQAGPMIDGGRAMGLALGYPETAVDAFANGTDIPPGQIGDRRAEFFGGFKFSSDNAAAERATALSWADAVQQASPVIYEQNMKPL